jgi:oxalate decarboxylase/phosphoglucose isomerase-like protein (cupin superfamily)
LAKPKGSRDPAKVAKHAFKKLFENNKVRVLDMRIRPGHKAAMHGHPAHVVYAFMAGSLMETTPKGKAREVRMKKGQVGFGDPTNHRVENKTKQDFHALVIELMR